MSNDLLWPELKHDTHTDHLIEKLILDPMLVGTKHREKLADLIDNFKDKYGEMVSSRVNEEGLPTTTFG